MSRKYSQTTRLPYQWVEQILKRIYDGDFVDEYECEGPIKMFIEDETKYVIFKYILFGINRDDVTSIDAWVHEMIEHSLSRIVPHVYGGILKFDLYIPLIGEEVSIYFRPTIWHIITALCTESMIDDDVVTSDEFANFFKRNFNNFSHI